MRKVTPKILAELKHLARMKDEDIDTSDIPEITDWTGAVVGRFYRPIKHSVTLRLDADVLDWFRAQGAGYQTRLNQALREYVTQRRTKAVDKPAVHERRASYAVRKRK